MSDQYVGALDCNQQILISVPNSGIHDPFHQELWAGARFHDLLDQSLVLILGCGMFGRTGANSNPACSIFSR